MDEMAQAEAIAAVLSKKARKLASVFRLGAHRADRPDYFSLRAEVTGGRGYGDVPYSALVMAGVLEEGIASRHGGGQRGYRMTPLGLLVADIIEQSI